MQAAQAEAMRQTLEAFALSSPRGGLSAEQRQRKAKAKAAYEQVHTEPCSFLK